MEPAGHAPVEGLRRRRLRPEPGAVPLDAPDAGYSFLAGFDRENRFSVGRWELSCERD